MCFKTVGWFGPQYEINLVPCSLFASGIMGRGPSDAWFFNVYIGPQPTTRILKKVCSRNNESSEDVVLLRTSSQKWLLEVPHDPNGGHGIEQGMVSSSAGGPSFVSCIGTWQARKEFCTKFVGLAPRSPSFAPDSLA